MPKHAVKAYGPFIRQALSKCTEEAEAYAKRLGNVLEGSWSNTTSIQPVDIPTILLGFKPRSFKLSEIATEYVGVKGIDPRPPRIALQSFISLAGDRAVGEYMREDAKLFLRHLEMSGNKTATRYWSTHPELTPLSKPKLFQREQSVGHAVLPTVNR